MTTAPCGRPGGDARKSIMAIDVAGLTLVTAPWVRPEPCVRCGLPTTGRFNEFGSARLLATHAECLRAARRELAAT